MSLSESIKNLTSNLTPEKKFIVALVICGLAIIWLLRDPIFNYAKLRNDRLEKKYRSELQIEKRVQAELDSIAKEKAKVEAELFIYKNNEINNLMVYLERRLPLSSHITVFSIHNGGGTPKTGTEAKISALYSTDNIKGINILKDYENIPLYPGYAEYAYQMVLKNGKPYYLPDVSQNSSVYTGRTKENMDLLNTKSIVGCYIKSSATATYYISVSFDDANGVTNEGREVVLSSLEYARNKLITLLDPK